MGQEADGLILVTGANGYIASRLIPRLLQSGRRVRAVARDPAVLRGRAWTSRVEVVSADVRMEDGLAAAMAGVQTAYYLIHSMASGRGYIQIERESARRFAAAAAEARLEHIIYLGGLADPHARNLAPHMRSRIETGEILRQGSVPVTEFRAGVIVGPGSISFEMIRFLTEFFPILVGPTWLRNRVQPIAADNVIDYLVAALESPAARGRVHEMGGPEQMLYADTMLRYARARGMKRQLVTVPGIPIWLMARLIDRLTPVPYAIATPLVGGLQSDSIVLDESARRHFPGIALQPYGEALRASLDELQPAKLEPVWEGVPGNPVRIRHEGFFIDHRRAEVHAERQAVFGIIASMGGERGWPYANWLWRLRGWLDGFVRRDGQPRTAPRAAEGAASAIVEHKGRPLKRGDQIDYYTVDAVESGCSLRLHSELRAPGEGWMEWRVEENEAGGSMLTQTAFFAPRGLPGLLYWAILGPIHRLVFRGMVGAIKRTSELR